MRTFSPNKRSVSEDGQTCILSEPFEKKWCRQERDTRTMTIDTAMRACYRQFIVTSCCAADAYTNTLIPNLQFQHRFLGWFFFRDNICMLFCFFSKAFFSRKTTQTTSNERTQQTLQASKLARSTTTVTVTAMTTLRAEKARRKLKRKELRPAQGRLNCWASPTPCTSTPLANFLKLSPRLLPTTMDGECTILNDRIITMAVEPVPVPALAALNSTTV